VKILILSSYYPPLAASGHDARCRQVSEGLARRGHRLQVLTSDFRLPPNGVDGEKGVYRELALAATHSDDELQALTYRDVLGLDSQNAATLDYRLTRFEPDIVLIWDLPSVSKSLLMRLQQSEVAVAYDLHSDYLFPEIFNRDPWQWWWRSQTSFGARLRKSWMTLTGARRRVLRKLPLYEPRDLDFSRAWLASDSLRQAFAERDFDALKDLEVYHSATDERSLTQKTKYLRRKRFMWAGRLSKGKAPELALEALILLKEAGVSVSLDVYGAGDPIARKAMREKINNIGLSDTVKMVSIRPGEIGQFYSAYDALLFTSRCDDPFPMTPIEAMWSGLPTILARDGGIQEVVTDGESGLLFERDSAPALAEAIQRFLSLPDAGEGLARACKQRLQASHSMDTYLNHTETLMLSRSAK
jgi:glycosyltransferase involved in cell wall biosynthesis